MFTKMVTKDNEEFITESELGTKQYWDQFYDEELTNFIDFGDSGETWFGTRNTRKIIDWVSENHAKNGIDSMNFYFKFINYISNSLRCYL